MKTPSLRRIYQRLRGGKLTLARTTGSIALGLFIGLLPLYGLHLPLCLGLSAWLGLDGVVAYAAANISNPFLAPFIVMFQIEVGSLLFTGRPIKWDLEQVKSVGVAAFTTHSLVGALVVAVAGAALGAGLTLALGLIWRTWRRPRELSHARARRDTLQRYRDVRPQDRHYVRIKLRTDPLTAELAALEFPLGHVTDAGCGRGQFGLFLFELGRTQSLYGFDWDSAKVATAARAAGSAGEYVVGDLRDPPLRPTDTVLLFDVLHYLTPEDQRRLLGKLYECLRPGGRLLLRDVEKNSGLLAAFTRLCEHAGTRLGMNRAAGLVFRSAATLRDELIALGFVLDRDCAEPTSRVRLLDNQLCIYRKPETE